MRKLKAKSEKCKVKKKIGFTLVETLVGVAIFLIISFGIYQSYLNILNLTKAARLKGLATLVANQQLEIAHNLTYENVGILNGLPRGLIPHTQTVTAAGVNFAVTTTIRNIDDPFDGVIGGTPNDLSPADHKLVEVLVECATCQNFLPFTVSTTIAPKNLETASGNGALFIKVFDANGEPVPQAAVHIVNNQVSPPLVIDDTTNNDGNLQLVDVPPDDLAYEISVSKTGYSSAQTYTIDLDNPNPRPPHSTVAIGQVTQISFAIDQTSQFDVKSITNLCAAAPNLSFNLTGGKTIGTSPTVLKYDNDFATNGAGEKIISNLEWDSYIFTPSSASYDLAGTIPLLPVALAPGTTQNVSLVMAPKNPKALLVIVKDGATSLPLADADVTLSASGFSESLITNRGFWRQTDWSGGPIQPDLFLDQTKFAALDSFGNVDYQTSAGELKLSQVGSSFQSPGWLESSIFDTGGGQSTYYNLHWSPANQPAETGPDSVKFQIAATSSLPSDFTYLGPDGTADTYYTLSDTNIGAIHNNQRYLRYKVFLTTVNPVFTPSLTDLSITFGSECLPCGQVFFNGLTTGTYSLNIAQTGYQPYTDDNVQISTDWETLEVSLLP